MFGLGIQGEAPTPLPDENELPEMLEHEITEEDLVNNPDLVGEVAVGDVVEVPEPVIDPTIKEINGKMYREIKKEDGTTELLPLSE